jgi:hypothetical protein
MTRWTLRVFLQNPVLSGYAHVGIIARQGDIETRLDLPIEWSVASPFLVDPPQVFVRAKEADPVVVEVVVRRKDNAPMALLGATCDLEGLTLSTHKAAAEKVTLRLAVNALPQNRFRRGEIRASMGSNPCDIVRIPISVLSPPNLKKGD